LTPIVFAAMVKPPESVVATLAKLPVRPESPASTA
jgi:hypothetical protein